jgi:hypothetical protein
MPPRGKSVTIWLSDKEHELLSTLARTQKKPVSVFGTEILKSYLRESPNQRADSREVLLAIDKLHSSIAKLREGLCYGVEKLLFDDGPPFKTAEEANEWVAKYVGQLE